MAGFGNFSRAAHGDSGNRGYHSDFYDDDDDDEPYKPTPEEIAKRTQKRELNQKLSNENKLYLGGVDIPYVAISGQDALHGKTDTQLIDTQQDVIMPGTKAKGSKIVDNFIHQKELSVWITNKNNIPIIDEYNKRARPDGWTAYYEPNAPNNKIRYRNRTLGIDNQIDRPLPPGWVQKMDMNRKFFYVHSSSGSWQYEYPLPVRWIVKTDTQNRKFHALSNDPNTKQYDQPVAATPVPTAAANPVPTAAANPTPTAAANPTPVAANPVPATQPPLRVGWEQLTEPSGRVYYGNPVLKKTQYERPLPLPLGWNELKDPNSGRTYYGNQALNQVQWNLPQAIAAAANPVAANPVPAPSVKVTPVEYYYKVGDGDFPYDIVANEALTNAIKSVCPKDNSTCHIELVRADPPQQAAIKDYNTKIQTKTKGGARNKKKHRRTKRRTSSKSHRMRRRTSQRMRA